jgi:hypothetical protein
MSKTPPAENADAPETAGARLGDLLTLRRRFLRSVSLERDARSAAGLDGYIPTPSALAALARVEAGLTDPAARAVTVTGPYGTGKSAFALYLTARLCLPPFGTGERANLFPVLVTGGREPLVPALLRALDAALHGQRGMEVEWSSADERDADVTAKEAAERFARAVGAARARYPDCGGLLVVVDELGKFLEYAAQHPERGDLQVLQEIAEMAARSPDDAPVVFVTVLHQSFDEYAHRLSAVQRAEWQKVQGRFLDVPFGDSAEDVIRLIGKAFETPGDARADAARRRAGEQARIARDLGLLPRGLEANPKETAALFAGGFGLHPVALLALPHLFKRFGQSERTLFSFLSSDAPRGFGAFLRAAGAGAQYRVDALYDYAIEAFGAGLYAVPGYGKLWSQIGEAVYRCENRGDAGGLAARVVKTVGLLHLLGESARLLPSAALVRFALAGAGADDPAAVDAALRDLTRETVLTYRRFKDAYRPYEGSDIDVEERLRDARAAVGGIPTQKCSVHGLRKRDCATPAPPSAASPPPASPPNACPSRP